MNSIKTKSKNYTIVSDKAIGGVIIEPTETGWMIYVAWEWQGCNAHPGDQKIISKIILILKQLI